MNTTTMNDTTYHLADALAQSWVEVALDNYWRTNASGFMLLALKNDEEERDNLRTTLQDFFEEKSLDLGIDEEDIDDDISKIDWDITTSFAILHILDEKEDEIKQAENEMESESDPLAIC